MLTRIKPYIYSVQSVALWYIWVAFYIVIIGLENVDKNQAIYIYSVQSVLLLVVAVVMLEVSQVVREPLILYVTYPPYPTLPYPTLSYLDDGWGRHSWPSSSSGLLSSTAPRVGGQCCAGAGADDKTHFPFPVSEYVCRDGRCLSWWFQTKKKKKKKQRHFRGKKKSPSDPTSTTPEGPIASTCTLSTGEAEGHFVAFVRSREWTRKGRRYTHIHTHTHTHTKEGWCRGFWTPSPLTLNP
jgi:hypothetical protein